MLVVRVNPTDGGRDAFSLTPPSSSLHLLSVGVCACTLHPTVRYARVTAFPTHCTGVPALYPPKSALSTLKERLKLQVNKSSEENGGGGEREGDYLSIHGVLC